MQCNAMQCNAMQCNAIEKIQKLLVLIFSPNQDPVNPIRSSIEGSNVGSNIVQHNPNPNPNHPQVG